MHVREVVFVFILGEGGSKAGTSCICFLTFSVFTFTLNKNPFYFIFFPEV